MSQPSPEVYEAGKGMDAHNAAMREIRARNDRTYDPHEPTRVWVDEDNTPDGVRDSLTIILNTGGCRWARAGGCTMWLRRRIRRGRHGRPRRTHGPARRLLGTRA